MVKGIATTMMQMTKAIMEGDLEKAKDLFKSLGKQFLELLKQLGEQALANLDLVMQATIGVSLEQMKTLMTALAKGDMKTFFETAKDIALSATGADVLLQFVDLGKALMEGDLEGALNIAVDMGLDQIGGGGKGKKGKSDGGSNVDSSTGPNGSQKDKGKETDKNGEGREVDVAAALDFAGIDVPPILEPFLPETVTIRNRKSKDKDNGSDQDASKRNRSDETKSEDPDKDFDLDFSSDEVDHMSFFHSLLENRDLPDQDEEDDKKKVKPRLVDTPDQPDQPEFRRESRELTTQLNWQ